MSPIPVKRLHARAKAPRGLPRPGTNPERVLAFLRAHPDDGWRASELAKRLRMDLHTLGSVLRRLRARALIDQIDAHWFALDDADIAKLHGMRLTTRLANEKWGPEDPADWPLIERE